MCVYVLEKYVGICVNTLKYFSNRTQRVQIDNVLSDFANIICDVPQGSVLGPLTICLYLLHLSAILRYHNIGYHVYDVDTQLYVSFKCKQPLEAIWMLTVNVYIIVIYVVITVDYCKCTLLYCPLNSYLYVHWILDFKYILLLLHVKIHNTLLKCKK